MKMHDIGVPVAVARMIWAMAVVIGVSLAGGVVAAMIGGSLDDLGSGAGGLYGLPALLLALLALLVTPVAARSALRLSRSRGWPLVALVLAGGVWVVAIGYTVVAHAVDPCVNGWWDTSSRVGSQPLCERYGSELNWHPRFHLLAHAAPAAVLLGMYIWGVRSWGRHLDPSDTTSAKTAVEAG